MKSIGLLFSALALVSTFGCQATPVPVPSAGVGVAPGHSHALPKHALVGYLHNFDNGQGLLPVG